MVVADASALVLATTDTGGRGEQASAACSDGASAPHLVDAEIGQAMRGLVFMNRLDPDAALESMRLAADLVTARVGHRWLADRAWELRANVSFHDALYVALAEARGLTLVTADGRLAGATGLRCRIQLV